MASLIGMLKEERGARGRVAVRLGWGIGDQILSSVTNVALGVVVARSVSAASFGAFSVAFTTYLVALGASRALNSETFLVRFSGVPERAWHDAASVMTGGALAIGIAFGAVCLVVGELFGASSDRAVFIVIGMSIPVALLQDAWRFAFVANGQSPLAFLTDLTWALVMVPTVAVVIVGQSASAALLAGAWGVSAAVATGVALAWGRSTPLVGRSFAWWRAQRDMCFRYLGEYVATSGAFQLTMYFLAVAAGLTAAGSFRGAFLLLGPVTLAFQGARVVLVPEGVRLLRRSSAHLHRAVVVLAVALVTIAAAWGVVLLVLPDSVGTAVLGESWDGARPLILPMAIMLAATGSELATLIGLRALAAPKRSFRTRMIEGTLTLVGGAIGALAGGATGAAWALAATFWVEVGVWWYQFRAELRAYGPASVGPE